MDRFLEAHRPTDEANQRLVGAIQLVQKTVEGLLAEGYTRAELVELIGLEGTHSSSSG